MKRTCALLLALATLLSTGCVIHQRASWDGGHYREVYYPGNSLQMVREH